MLYIVSVTTVLTSRNGYASVKSATARAGVFSASFCHTDKTLMGGQ